MLAAVGAQVSETTSTHGWGSGFGKQNISDSPVTRIPTVLSPGERYCDSREAHRHTSSQESMNDFRVNDISVIHHMISYMTQMTLHLLIWTPKVRLVTTFMSFFFFFPPVISTH